MEEDDGDIEGDIGMVPYNTVGGCKTSVLYATL